MWWLLNEPFWIISRALWSTHNIHQVGFFCSALPSGHGTQLSSWSLSLSPSSMYPASKSPCTKQKLCRTHAAMMNFTSSSKSKWSRKRSLLHLPFKSAIALSTICLIEERVLLNLRWRAVRCPLSLLGVISHLEKTIVHLVDCSFIFSLHVSHSAVRFFSAGTVKQFPKMSKNFKKV